MDKNKVTELIEDTILMVDTIEGFDDGDTEQLSNVMRKLNDALEEIHKSDWVSVEDELPEYGENVLVCNEKEPSDMWFGHRTSDRRVVVDEHEFAKGYGTITHWHKIDKLEE